MEEKLVKSILLASANASAPPEKMGRPRTDHGLMIDTFIRVLRTVMPWRDVRDVPLRLVIFSFAVPNSSFDVLLYPVFP